MEQGVSVPGFSWPVGAAPVVGVDVGGTKVAVCVADARGLRGRLVEPTVKVGPPDALATQILRLLEQSCAAAGLSPQALAAVGVAACGPFVLNHGLVELATPNICGGMAGATPGLSNAWQTVPLEAPLRQRFATVRVENDAVGALEAERRWGALQVRGQPLANCAYVTWSTGVGGGLCVDGRVLRGKHGNAGHVGHLFVTDDAQARCGCGNVGDVEALTGGAALARRFGAAGYADAAQLFEAAAGGDSQADAIIDDLCRVMGRNLYNLIVTLDLARISLGGRVFWLHQARLLPGLQRQINGRLPALTAGCELVPAGLGEHVGDLAALALVL